MPSSAPAAPYLPPLYVPYPPQTSGSGWPVSHLLPKPGLHKVHHVAQHRRPVLAEHPDTVLADVCGCVAWPLLLLLLLHSTETTTHTVTQAPLATAAAAATGAAATAATAAATAKDPAGAAANFRSLGQHRRAGPDNPLQPRPPPTPLTTPTQLRCVSTAHTCVMHV
jgi:hypothetical protein